MNPRKTSGQSCWKKWLVCISMFICTSFSIVFNVLMFASPVECIRVHIQIACAFGGGLGVLVSSWFSGIYYRRSWKLRDESETTTGYGKVQLVFLTTLILQAFIATFTVDCKGPSYGTVLLLVDTMFSFVILLYTGIVTLLVCFELAKEIVHSSCMVPSFLAKLKVFETSLHGPPLEQAKAYRNVDGQIKRISARENLNQGPLFRFQIKAACCLFAKKTVASYVVPPPPSKSFLKRNLDPHCCLICAEAKPSLQLPYCGHRYHSDCLRKWLVSSETCAFGEKCRQKQIKVQLVKFSQEIIKQDK